MARAVSGCNIVEENQATGRMIYEEKCEKCGYIMGNKVHTGIVKKGTTLNRGFTCPKCRNHQKIVIKG